MIKLFSLLVLTIRSFGIASSKYKLLQATCGLKFKGFEDSGGDSGDSGDSGARMIYPHARMMIEKVGCSA